MFITSRNSSQLRELISLADRERNNPEVILMGCRKHPETIRRQSKCYRTTCGRRGADTRREQLQRSGLCRIALKRERKSSVSATLPHCLECKGDILLAAMISDVRRALVVR